MKYLIPIALALMLTSCAAPPPEKRINLSLENKTDNTIVLNARAGWLGRSVQLKPGESWIGWVPRSFNINEIKVEVRKPRKSKKKRGIRAN